MRFISYLFVVTFSLFLLAGSSTLEAQSTEKTEIVTPFSDPDNKQGWVLNKDLSDEFEGNKLDPEKWFIEGQNGDYYIWKGRAPAQFVPHNAIVEDGKLKIRTQWEPDYPFDQEGYKESGKEAYGSFQGKPLPVTTAGVITNKRFLYGYMEIKSKAGHAAITAAFWAIGYEQELDIFEQMGNPKIHQEHGITAKTVRTAVHDWSPPAVRPTKAFGYDDRDLDYTTGKEFHVYGAEWGEDYLKVYRDGKLTFHITQDELGTDWVLNNPMEIWLDSEAFSWIGVPHEEELPVDFEIEYLRVWQKPDPNLIDRAFFGFEGPILFEENPRPLMLVPENSENNDYQQFWRIDSTSAKYLTIVEGDYATGVNSLQFSGYGKNEELESEKVAAISPEGAVDLPAGDYVLSMKVWMDQGREVKQLHLCLKDGDVQIPIDLTGLERRKWVTIEQKFTKTTASTDTDQFTIEIRKEDMPKVKARKFFIDDIKIRKAE